jgi:hypothetical protein
MEVTPSETVTSVIISLYSDHGGKLIELHAPIAPVPVMLSTPVSVSNVQVTLDELAVGPQSPL